MKYIYILFIIFYRSIYILCISKSWRWWSNDWSWVNALEGRRGRKDAKGPDVPSPSCVFTSAFSPYVNQCNYTLCLPGFWQLKNPQLPPPAQFSQDVSPALLQAALLAWVYLLHGSNAGKLPGPHLPPLLQFGGKATQPLVPAVLDMAAASRNDHSFGWLGPDWHSYSPWATKNSHLSNTSPPREKGNGGISKHFVDRDINDDTHEGVWEDWPHIPKGRENECNLLRKVTW